MSLVLPFIPQLVHFCLHLQGHLDAAKGVILVVGEFGVAKKNHDGVADELVNGPAPFVGDGAHLGEVLVKDLPGVFGFEFVGPGRKAADIGEEDRESPALVIRLGGAVALGQRIHELAGQVNLELIGQVRDLLLGFQQAVLRADGRVAGNESEKYHHEKKYQVGSRVHQFKHLWKTELARVIGTV